MRISKNDVRLLTNEATYNGGYTIPLADVLGRYVVGGLRTVTLFSPRGAGRAVRLARTARSAHAAEKTSPIRSLLAARPPALTSSPPAGELSAAG